MNQGHPRRLPLDWLDGLSGTRNVKDAVADVAKPEPWRRNTLAQARGALELADRVARPLDPLRHGRSSLLALSLYRQALTWALRAWSDGIDATDRNDTPDSETLLAAVGREEQGPRSADRLDEARAILIRSFVTDAREEDSRIDADNALLRELTCALLEPFVAPHLRLARARRMRMLRVGIVVVTLVVCIMSAVKVARGRRPDLARGKPWKASSSLATCTPSAHTCGGAFTDILFHTAEDEEPWFEIDLGVPTRFSSVEVRNRTDSFEERAIPLIVELSDDERTWREVARCVEVFDEWSTDRMSQTARYVRLRVPRKTFLHLEWVRIFR